MPKRQNAGTTPNRIVWSSAEWQIFAHSLHVNCSHLHFLDSIDLAGLSTTVMNEAALTLSVGRQRRFPALEVPRARLLEIYRAARLARHPLFYPSTPPAPIERAFQRAPAPVADVPVFIPKQQRPLSASTPRSKNVIWTRAEWLLLAAELHRMFPHASYPDSADLAGMCSGDVDMAQRVLPDERRRLSVRAAAFQTHLCKPLLSAFRDLNNRAVSAAMLAAIDQAKESVSEPAPLPKPESAPACVASLPNLPVGVNPYEAAFKPLLDLLVGQLLAQMQPLLRPMLIDAMQAAMPPVLSPAPPVTPFGAIFSAEKPRAVTLPAAVLRQRSTHIGVIGNRNAYHTDLEAAFPHIRFTCIDSIKQIESVRNCDRVIGMIKWTSHAIVIKARKVVGERFVQIDGSLSEIKRVISLWMTSGVLRDVAQSVKV